MDDFYVYKITNKKNNKFYIGVHKGDFPNDGYCGSGIAIKQALKKYGKEAFTREVLFLFKTKEEAYLKEKELVTESVINNRLCYNMKTGGYGGWPKMKMTKEERQFIWKNKTEEEKKEYSLRGQNQMIQYYKEHPEAREIQSQKLKALYEKNPELRINLSQKATERYSSFSEEKKQELRLRKKRIMNQPEVRKRISEAMKKADKQSGFNNPSSKKRASVYDKLYGKYKNIINYTNISNDELLSLFKKEGESLKLVNFFNYISYKENKRLLSKKYKDNFSFCRITKIKTWIEQDNNSYEELKPYYPISIDKKIKQILDNSEAYFRFRTENKTLPDHFLEKRIPGFLRFLKMAEYLGIIKIDKKVKLNHKDLLDSLYTIYGITEKEFNRNKMKKDKCSITFFSLENSLTTLIGEGKVICK